MSSKRAAPWVVILAAVLVGGCSAASVTPDGGSDSGDRTCTDHFAMGPDCGNGVCDVTETCLTCTADCACCADAGP